MATRLTIDDMLAVVDGYIESRLGQRAHFTQVSIEAMWYSSNHIDYTYVAIVKAADRRGIEAFRCASSSVDGLLEGIGKKLEETMPGEPNGAVGRRVLPMVNETAVPT